MSSISKLEIINKITSGSPNRIREKWFVKNSPETYNQIIEFTKNISDISFPFKIWHWVNNKEDYMRCYCGKKLSQNMNWKNGYKKYCSNKCSANSEETKDKLKKTALEKWGVEHYSKTEDWVKKVKETSLKNWGVDNFSKTEDYLEKSKKTYLLKWGVDNFTKTQDYKEKSKETSLKNWGVEFPTQSEVVKNKISETNLKKWGVNHIFKSEQYRIENFKISNNPFYEGFEGGLNLFKCDHGLSHKFTIKTDDYYGRLKSGNGLCTVCHPISDSSSIKETMLFNFIKEIYEGDIIRGFREERMEIDVYLPDLKIGFEFNGIWWHSERYKDKSYHIKKTEFFEERDIRIIHIWEDDWANKTDIIKSQIMSWMGLTKRKIFARKCKIHKISSKLASQFLNENHIQGVDRSSIKLGLYYEQELVSIMTFDHFEGRKKMSDGEWNLSRFCNKLNTQVIGGASKLLDYFIKNHNTKRIISYADRDWSGGDLYKKLDFDYLGTSNPDYKYVLNDRRIHKSRFRKSRTGISESNLGLTKIWDCGKIKFEKIIK
jgi:hypothetical protein